MIFTRLQFASQAEGFGRFAIGGLKMMGQDHCVMVVGKKSPSGLSLKFQERFIFCDLFRCHFSQHDKTMLIGADPSHIGDRCIRVSIHHCFFDGTRQRHSCVRYGKVHLYNNYTRNWGIYAFCASVESQAVDKDEASTGCMISEGDLFITGTQPGRITETAAGQSNMFHPSEHYPTSTNRLPQPRPSAVYWIATRSATS